MLKLITRFMSSRHIPTCTFFIQCFLLLSGFAAAQINGPTTVLSGSTQTYVFDNGITYMFGGWTVTNGTVTSSIVSGTTYTGVVQWGSVGSGVLTFKNKATLISTLNVSVCSSPSAPSVTFSYSSRCPVHNNEGAIISYSGTPPSGETWYWQSPMDGPTGTNTALGSGNNLTTKSNEAGPFYLRPFNSYGWGNALATADIPARAGFVTGTSGCTGASYTLSAVNSYGFAQGFRWYDACVGGNVLQSSSVPANSTGTFTTPVLTTTTTYYLAVYNLSTGAESGRLAITATILTTPVTMVGAASPSVFCASGGTTTLSATGAGANDFYQWYTVPSGGTPLASNTQTISATTTFYVAGKNINTQCEGPRTSVTVNVNPVIGIPNVDSTPQCVAGGAYLTGTPGANANSIRWYNYATGGTVQGTGLNSPTVSASTTFYAASYNTITDCEGTNPRVASTISIPQPPTASSASFCGTGPFTIQATPPGAARVRWYDAPTGGTLLAMTFGTSPQTYVTTTYYIVSHNGCESTAPRLPITITVNPLPAVPIVSNTVMCGKGSLTGATGANGTTIRWYNGGGSLLTTGNSSPLTLSTTTYTLTTYNETTWCESAPVTATLTIYSTPLTPTFGSTNICNAGSITGTPGTNGQTLNWYNAASGGNLLPGSPSVTSPNVSASTTFYTTTFNTTTGCESATRTPVTITVNTSPSPPTVMGNTRFGVGTVTLTASGGTAYEWFNAAGTSQSTNPTFAPKNTLTVDDVLANAYYAKTLSNGCYSAATQVTLKAFSLPTVAANPPRLVMGGSATLDGGAGYDSYVWKNSANTTLSTAQFLTSSSKDTYTLNVTKEGAATTATFVLGNQQDGLNENYIITNAIQVSNITDPAQIPNLPVESNTQSIQYYDGLGRPMQTVGTQASPTKKDLVQNMVYDAFGRDSKKYLPYSFTSNDGWYKQNAMLDPQSSLTDPEALYHSGMQWQFYQSATKVAADVRPYTETVFEPSPLNRPDKDFGVGQDWYTNNRHVKHDYLINVHGTAASQERVIAWKVDPNGLPVPAAAVIGYVEAGGYYANGQLSIKSTKDEQGNEVREYVDKEGRTILKKVQAVSGIAQTNNDTHWAMTYYIYDDFGNLSVVLPPEAVKAITAQ